MTKRVMVLGGGVGGLTAAHELSERGFEVEVFERRHALGGKARSMGDPHTGTGGRRDLPGEHGFRFFPGFYRHLPDTMKRIPFDGKPHGTYDNLVASTHFRLAKQGTDARFVARFPTSLEGLHDALEEIFGANLGIPHDELRYFAERVLIILTSCEERRLAEYEKIPWWTFVGAETRSTLYRQYLVEGITRSLAAMKAEIGNTRTVGNTLIQLLLDLTTPGDSLDRVLNGPTSDVFIGPWRDYLAQRGVRFHCDTEVVALHCEGARITGVTVKDRAGPREAAADYYVAALPVEVMTPLVTPEMKRADPGLGAIAELRYAWMSGIQFYLRTDVPLVRGHTVYVDTPFALTSISQAQFWNRPLASFGDGTVNGCLSVDISDWNTPGILYGKPAMQLSRDEIKDEVWAQLRRSLDAIPDAAKLDDANLVAFHLDPDILFPNPHETVNLEPLLVHYVDNWRFRPEAVTAIPNLLLASDYVRTHTDIASMEASNEAARRAVNGILADSGSSAPPCEIWPLREPDIFAPARAFDYVRFKLGLPHAGVTATLAGAAPR